MVDPVECRSDQEYAGRPQALQWQNRRLEVIDLMQTWRSPEGKRFRVKTEGGLVFDLLYREESDSWEISQL